MKENPPSHTPPPPKKKKPRKRNANFILENKICALKKLGVKKWNKWRWCLQDLRRGVYKEITLSFDFYRDWSFHSRPSSSIFPFDSLTSLSVAFNFPSKILTEKHSDSRNLIGFLHCMYGFYGLVIL